MRSIDRGTLKVCVLLWVGTCAATGAAAIASIGLQETMPPYDALPASFATFSDLTVANLAVAAWPVGLVWVRWHEIRPAALIGDALVVGQLAVNALLVGDAIAQQPRLWRYLPHLPVEWLALAVGASAWVQARRGTQCRMRSLAALVAGLVLAAAAIETWAVPW